MKEKKAASAPKHHKTYLLFKKSRLPKRSPLPKDEKSEHKNPKKLKLNIDKKYLKKIGPILAVVAVIMIFFILPSLLTFQGSEVKEKPRAGCLSAEQIQRLQKEGKKISNALFGYPTNNLNNCVDKIVGKWHIARPLSMTVQVQVKNPYLKLQYLKLTQTPPNTAAISILNTPASIDRTAYLDDNGNEINFAQEIDIPAMQIYTHDTSKKFKSEWIKELKQFFSHAREQKYEVGVLQLTQFGTLRTRVNNEFDILVDLNTSIEQQLSSLQAVRSQTTINTNRLGTVDLRFTNPVLTFTQ